MKEELSIEDVVIYEVLNADGDCVGYSLQREPGTADVADGRRHRALTDPPGPGSYLHLVGVNTIAEAMCFGYGAVVGRGEDNAGWIAQQVTPGLAVCLVEWYREGSGIDREDYRDTLCTGDPAADDDAQSADNA